MKPFAILSGYSSISTLANHEITGLPTCCHAAVVSRRFGEEFQYRAVQHDHVSLERRFLITAQMVHQGVGSPGTAEVCILHKGIPRYEEGDMLNALKHSAKRL